MPENGTILPTAHYTGEPGEARLENTGEKRSKRARTAQNTHNGRLERPKRRLPKYLVLEEKDALFRAVVHRGRARPPPRAARHVRHTARTPTAQAKKLEVSVCILLQGCGDALCQFRVDGFEGERHAHPLSPSKPGRRRMARHRRHARCIKRGSFNTKAGSK